MVKVGIIGCGKIAQVRHIPEYLSNADAEIAGFYDLNFQRAQELAEKYHCTAYKSIEELLNNKSWKTCTLRKANGNNVEGLPGNGRGV